MSLSPFPNDPRVIMYLNQQWTDVSIGKSDGTGYVRQIPIEISTGTDDESAAINPGYCKFTLDNPSGRFNPRNPMGPYFGSLNVNTPVAVLNDEIKDTYTRVAPNTWANTDTGETYVTASLGAPINATDYSTDGSKGIHSVPTTTAYRMSYFDSTTTAPITTNLFQKIRFTLPFTDVTGGPLEPGNLVCRLISSTQYYLCRLEIQTDESVTLKIMKDGASTIAGPITVPSITHVAGQGIWVKFGAFDSTLMATAWVGDNRASEPTGWLVTGTDTSYSSGRYGVRTGVSATNTNAKPIVASYDNYQVYLSEFNGEIPDFKPDSSDDGLDQFVPIEAAGILRRQSETKNPLLSCGRRWYEGYTTNGPNWFWPLEDGALANTGKPSITPPGQNAEFEFSFAASTDTSHEVHFGQGKLGSWLPNGVSLKSGDIVFTGLASGSADLPNNQWRIDWVRAGGANTPGQTLFAGFFDPGVTVLGSPIDTFAIIYIPATPSLEIHPGLSLATVTLNTSLLPTNVYDGAVHHYSWYMTAVGGNIFWEFFIDGNSVASNTEIAHPFIANMYAVEFLANAGADPCSWGSCALWTTNTWNTDFETAADRVLGQQGEASTARFIRINSEEGINFFTTSGTGAAMGPQHAGDTVLNIYEEIVNTDGGVLRELLSARVLTYEPLEALRAKSNLLTLNVGNKEIALGAFKPIPRDTQNLRNKIRASKRDGGSFTYQKTTGPTGTADPKLGGAGVYADQIDTNPQLESQLEGIAQREVAEGTVDKTRFPEIAVDLMADVIKNNLTLRRKVLSAFIATRMTLTGMTNYGIYEDAKLLIIGMTRVLSHFTHKITWNTRPFDPFDIFHVETAGSILGTESSVITTAVNDSATALDVITTGNALWTTNAGSFPILSRMEGEDINVTNVVTTPPSFRSVGAATHADNLTLNPALPAGQAAGDTLICVSAIRNTAATAQTPAGYSSLTFGTPGLENFNICFKISVGAGEATPSCTFTGGAAGDTTSAFVIALQNAPIQFGANGIVNGSTQNITLPSLQLLRCNGILMVFGWKQDDYTTIDPPPYMTEIIEASTVTGNDQGLYAAYKITSRTDFVVSDTLTVTGGAAAISKAVLWHFQNPQRLTVIRSVNQVVKSHTANTPITVAYPKVLG